MPDSRLAPRTLGAVFWLTVALLGGCHPAAGSVARGASVYRGCSPCHGADGRGQEELGAPAIAGLSQWYVEAQLKKFRSSFRGDHPDDHTGLRMRPMAKAMARDSDVTAVAAYVASMPGALPPAVVTGGDAERGRAHYQSCVACHGANGEGVQPLNGPSLNRTNDWYQLAQMQKFKQGIRGSNAADVTGSTMRPLIDPLPDEQAMKDVLAFLWTVSQ